MFFSVSFKAGLLQPPVRIVSQPQPARRLDPPSRFSGRNDRGDQVPNRKDDRRYVFQSIFLMVVMVAQCDGLNAA